MKLLKNFCLVGVSIIISYAFSGSLGYQLSKRFNFVSGYLDFTSLYALIYLYTLLIVFLFTAFGDRKKYWWIGISLIPAVAVELLEYFHLYIPIILGLAGWLIGYGVSKLLKLFWNKPQIKA
jgi:hypothetical protein